MRVHSNTETACCLTSVGGCIILLLCGGRLIVSLLLNPTPFALTNKLSGNDLVRLLLTLVSLAASNVCDIPLVIVGCNGVLCKDCVISFLSIPNEFPTLNASIFAPINLNCQFFFFTIFCHFLYC